MPERAPSETMLIACSHIDYPEPSYIRNLSWFLSRIGVTEAKLAGIIVAPGPRFVFEIGNGQSRLHFGPRHCKYDGVRPTSSNLRHTVTKTSRIPRSETRTPYVVSHLST